MGFHSQTAFNFNFFYPLQSQKQQSQILKLAPQKEPIHKPHANQSLSSAQTPTYHSKTGDLYYCKNIRQDYILDRQMYTDKIREAFERIGFTGETTITQAKFNDILSKLMSTRSNEPYDKDVADELWEQASNGRSSIQINQVCETIDDGINILQSKLEEINNQIRDLQRAKLSANNSSAASQMEKIQNDIENLEQDRAQFQQDLRLVTLPFGINVMSRNSLRYGAGNVSGSRIGESGVMEDADENEELRYILYLSIIFGVIEVIIIYAKYDFLNLMVVTCLLSIYLLNHFDNLYIKLSLILLAVSEVLDIIWLFMYASQKWNPPTVGNDSKYEREYLRFIVFFTIVIIAIKIPIGYYLYRIKNINDNKYIISMGMFKLILNANKSNPITRNLTNALAPNA